MTAIPPDGTAAPTHHATQAAPREAHRIRGMTHLLASALYAAGVYGLLGGFILTFGPGLGILLLALGIVIAGRASLRHHGRFSAPAAIGAPRSLLAAWAAGGPLSFLALLPETTPLRATVLIALLLATTFFTALRLEDAELTAQAAPNPAS